MVLTEVLAEARHLESSERSRYVCLVVRVYKHRPCIQLLAGGRGRKGLNSERERRGERVNSGKHVGGIGTGQPNLNAAEE